MHTRTARPYAGCGGSVAVPRARAGREVIELRADGRAHGANSRFFFFLPPPGGPFVGSCGAGAMDGALVAVPPGAGAGVTDDRPPVAVTGVSGTVSSGGAAGSWKDSRACSAVVRMAWNSSSLTLCRLESPAAVPRAPEMPSPSWVCVSSAAGSPSCARFFPALSPDEGSTIGHTKPVRGVYAGLWERRMSREFCSDCRDVSY